MAKRKLCTIPGCDKRVFARGWCQSHWTRWRRNGDPIAGRTPVGSPSLFYENALTHAGDECLLWPFVKTLGGYGHMRANGGTQLVHRLVCQATHGDAPSGDYEAAHSCGNRSCINPAHLSWKTPAANTADKVVHGTDSRGERNGFRKLSEADVRAIRQMDRSHRKIAAMYGVSKSTVTDIRSGKNWGWLP